MGWDRSLESLTDTDKKFLRFLLNRQELDEAEKKTKELEARLDFDEGLLRFILQRKNSYRDLAIRWIDWKDWTGWAESTLDALLVSAQTVGETSLTLSLTGVAREAGLPVAVAKTGLYMLREDGLIEYEIRDSTIGEIVEVELMLGKGI